MRRRYDSYCDYLKVNRDEEEEEDTFSCLKSPETSGGCWYRSVPLWHQAANLVSKPLWVWQSTNLVQLYAPAEHSFKKYWYMGYPKKKTGTYKISDFRDMGYPRDIPKKIRYIETFNFLGYGISHGIYQKKSGTQKFSVFLGYGISLGYPIKFPVHRVSLFFRDMGYSRDISQKVDGKWISLILSRSWIYQSPRKRIYQKNPQQFLISFSLSLFFGIRNIRGISFFVFCTVPEFCPGWRFFDYISRIPILLSEFSSA